MKIMSLARRAGRKLEPYRFLPQYLWIQKLRFGVRRTKFDISYCVFRESYLEDQYEIRRFLDAARGEELLFVDIGRNHGLVFHYAVDHILRARLPIRSIRYVGIDPAPLKFVYFNRHRELAEAGIHIDYRLIDRAVVTTDERSVRLKYGEHNFGNFNVGGSNYDEKLSRMQDRFEFVEIEVETITLDEIRSIVEDSTEAELVVVKIDCKYQTDRIFLDMLETLEGREQPYLVACERDGSAEITATDHLRGDANVLIASNAFAGAR